MANTLLTIDMITRKALEILENKSVLSRTVNRQYDSSFAQSGAKIGSTLRIRKPVRYITTSGAALQVQDTTEDYTTLTVSNQAQIAVNFTTAEMTMQLDDFAETILKPAISQMATTIDSDIANAYKNIYSSVGTPGTTPSTSLVMLQANQKMTEYATPDSPRYLTINPAANAALIDGQKGLFNPNTTISRQFKSGLMAEGTLGFDEISQTQNLKMFTTGSAVERATGLTVDATLSTQGVNTITFAGATNAKTIVPGDVFTIAGVYAVNPQTRESTGSLQQFVATNTTTSSGTKFTNVTFSPAIYTASQQLATVDTFPQATAAVVLMGAASTAYPQNLAYHKNAITFATADLIMPNGVDMASRIVHNGISMRAVRQYDINNDRMPLRIDVLYGYSVIRPEMAVRMWG